MFKTTTKVITCADSFVYLAKYAGISKTYFVAIRMNMATLKTTSHWWYKYSDGKIFFPDSEGIEIDTLARIEDELRQVYAREFLLSDVKRLYSK